jgi:uncharacterized protein
MEKMDLMHGSPDARALTIDVEHECSVSALLCAPPNANVCYVLAHGAGAGMTHPFMAAIAGMLAVRGIATLRYQFPYMEHGSKRPDTPSLAQATVRAAVLQAAQVMPRVTIVAGGKSFGGRMTSQAQAAIPLPGVAGLILLGFPLHPAGMPSDRRGEHLVAVNIPMLFVQGTRDRLAEMRLLQPVVANLGERATLALIADADHSFHVPARSGRNDGDVRGEVIDVIAAWCSHLRR